MGEFHGNGKRGVPGLPWKMDVDNEEDRAWLAIHNIVVKLDGERQIAVAGFNTKAGKLTRYKMDNGRPMIEDGSYVTETIKGNVTVEWTA